MLSVNLTPTLTHFAQYGQYGQYGQSLHPNHRPVVVDQSFAKFMADMRDLQPREPSTTLIRDTQATSRPSSAEDLGGADSMLD